MHVVFSIIAPLLCPPIPSHPPPRWGGFFFLIMVTSPLFCRLVVRRRRFYFRVSVVTLRRFNFLRGFVGARRLVDGNNPNDEEKFGHSLRSDTSQKIIQRLELSDQSYVLDKQALKRPPQLQASTAIITTTHISYIHHETFPLITNTAAD
jgi:hypothetical protein